MESHDRGRDVPLDSDEAKQNAQDIENYRLSVMHERWLSTLILTTHIEIEALLVELLRRNLPRPQKLLERKTMRPSFSQKLVTCEALNLVDDDVAEGIWAVNLGFYQFTQPLVPLSRLYGEPWDFFGSFSARSL